ncbi:MAG: hypothetical protein LOD94_06340 [Gammaproteobacteria bacterium]|nr:hypothetical protein [Gammaproteobacteria bacterium]
MTVESGFNEAMLDIYRRAKSEAGYTASAFLKMVVEHGGVEAARMLIHSQRVSSGYTELWERGRLDLSMEAMIVETPRFHELFSPEEIEICRKRLADYGYQPRVRSS